LFSQIHEHSYIQHSIPHKIEKRKKQGNNTTQQGLFGFAYLSLSTRLSTCETRLSTCLAGTIHENNFCFQLIFNLYLKLFQLIFCNSPR